VSQTQVIEWRLVKVMIVSFFPSNGSLNDKNYLVHNFSYVTVLLFIG